MNANNKNKKSDDDIGGGSKGNNSGNNNGNKGGNNGVNNGGNNGGNNGNNNGNNPKGLNNSKGGKQAWETCKTSKTREDRLKFCTSHFEISAVAKFQCIVIIST